MKSIVMALVFSALVVSLYGQRFELRVVDKGDRAHVQIRNISDHAVRTSENRVTDIVFGVKWRETGIEFLEIMHGSYQMKYSDGVRDHKGYRFQAFGAMQTPYLMPVDWKKEAWVDLVVFKVHGTRAVTPKPNGFELAETGFHVTTDPNIGIDLVDETPKIVGYAHPDVAVNPNGVLMPNLDLDVTRYGPRHAHLTWSIDNPDVVRSFVVERRLNDEEWNSLAILGSEGQFVHVYVDEDVYDGVTRHESVFYRVRVHTDAGERMSVERGLDFSSQKMITEVFPNPATDKLFVEMTPTITDGKAYLELYGRDGRLVYRSEILPGSVKEQINLAASNIESGSYTVHLLSDGEILDAHPLHVMR